MEGNDMHKIKVFHLIGSLNIGGIQNVVFNMFNSIDRTKYEFYFGVFDYSHTKLEQEIINMGGNIIVVPEIKKNYYSYYQNLKRILKVNGEFEVFHSHLHLNNGIALMAAENVGIPIRISHSHSVRRSNQKKSYIYSIYEKIMLKMIRHYSNVQIACSRAAGKYMFGDGLFTKNGIVFPNSINIEKFQFSKEYRKEIRQILGFQNKLVIGNVGTLNIVKNQELIIQLVNELIKDGKPVVGIIIGEGKERLQLEDKIQQYGLNKDVLLIGNDVKVSEYLSAMDIFVFPSLHEGLGIAAIEAQANGLPVIISDGVPDEVRIKNNVYRVPLDCPIEEWASITWKIRENRLNFDNLELINAGYNSSDSGRIIQKIYEDALVRLGG